MASRIETQKRKQALIEDLRDAYREGRWEGGQALSLRALSTQYDLSMQTVGVELQTLVREGVLYTVPRVGTFMGRSPVGAVEPFMLLSPHDRSVHIYLDQVQTGFEDRIAHLGGISDAMTSVEAVQHLKEGDLPALSGLLYMDSPLHSPVELQELNNLPRVVLGDGLGHQQPVDTVDFDNEDGGMQAARHLLQVGHRKIAYLGLHGRDGNAGRFSWSVERSMGWQRVLSEAGQDAEKLLFIPSQPGDYQPEAQQSVAREVAIELVRRSDITAVIAVNVFATHGLVEALRDAKIPAQKWPAIVAFDETPKLRSSGLSYLRLPWEKIGAEAAQVLWERKAGRLTGPPQRRLVKMNLIPRLTCRPDWTSASGGIQRRVLDMAVPHTVTA